MFPNRIVVGDRYRLPGKVAEVVAVSETMVTLKVTDGAETFTRSHSLAAFDLIERNTFKLGADFEPAGT